MRYLLVAALVLTGCSQKLTPQQKADAGVTQASASVHVAELTDQQKISLLRNEAHRRGLKWHIFCLSSYEGDPEEFMGEAAPHDGAFSLYAENGGKGLWLETANSQGEAAYALYLAIQGSVTHPAEHRTTEPERKRRMCPPELRGD